METGKKSLRIYIEKNWRKKSFASIKMDFNDCFFSAILFEGHLIKWLTPNLHYNVSQMCFLMNTYICNRIHEDIMWSLWKWSNFFLHNYFMKKFFSTTLYYTVTTRQNLFYSGLQGISKKVTIGSPKSEFLR